MRELGLSDGFVDNDWAFAGTEVASSTKEAATVAIGAIDTFIVSQFACVFLSSLEKAKTQNFKETLTVARAHKVSIKASKRLCCYVKLPKKICHFFSWLIMYFPTGLSLILVLSTSIRTRILVPYVMFNSSIFYASLLILNSMP